MFLRGIFRECHGDMRRMDLLDAVELMTVVGMTVSRHMRRTEHSRYWQYDFRVSTLHYGWHIKKGWCV